MHLRWNPFFHLTYFHRITSYFFTHTHSHTRWAGESRDPQEPESPVSGFNCKYKVLCTIVTRAHSVVRDSIDLHGCETHERTNERLPHRNELAFSRVSCLFALFFRNHSKTRNSMVTVECNTLYPAADPDEMIRRDGDIFISLWCSRLIQTLTNRRGLHRQSGESAILCNLLRNDRRQGRVALKTSTCFNCAPVTVEISIRMFLSAFQ